MFYREIYCNRRQIGRYSLRPLRCPSRSLRLKFYRKGREDLRKVRKGKKVQFQTVFSISAIIKTESIHYTVHGEKMDILLT